MPARIIQQRFNFKESACVLKILLRNKSKVVIVFTEVADDLGASVTEAFEKIAAKVYQQFLSEFSIKDIIWFEDYSKNSYHRSGDYPEVFE